MGGEDVILFVFLYFVEVKYYPMTGPERPEDHVRQRGIVPYDKQLDLAIRDSRLSGFSPLLPERLNDLSDVLLRNAPSETRGFNLTLELGAVNPVDLEIDVRPPFVIEIAG